MSAFHASRQGVIAQAAGFDPASIAGLAEWLKADAITGLADGDPVTTWVASGGVDFAQSTAAQKPTYRPTGLNAKPTVRFDGIDDRLLTTALSVASGSKTFFVVGDPKGTTGERYWFDSDIGRLVIIHAAGGSAGFYDGAYKLIATATTGPQVLEWVLTSGANGELFRNGASLGTAAYTARAIGGATALGGAQDAATGAPINADISELLVYDSALSAANRSSVRSYLGARWGIAVT